MSFIKSCYGNIGKWRSTMFTWPPVVLFIYLQSFTTLPEKLLFLLSLKMQYQIIPPCFLLQEPVGETKHDTSKEPKKNTLPDLFIYLRRILRCLHKKKFFFSVACHLNFFFPVACTQKVFSLL